MLKRILGIGKKDDAEEKDEPSAGSDTPRRLSRRDLKEIVSDASELAKGTQIMEAGALSNLSRYGERLFADAKGSGQAPYRVSVVVAPNEAKARCTCFAARSRPFCKHGAALVVAWADTPDAFIVAENAPPEVEAGKKKKKKSVKKGKRESRDLMSQGVSQVDELARQLAVSGVASLTAERVSQIHSLGENLREFRLRRLSARTLDLTKLLDSSLGGDLDAVQYTNLVVDLVLTAAKLQKHLEGAELEDRYVEELVGKTWRKKDRTSVDALDLVEYAFSSRATSDQYTIRESRFVDVATGTHYSEKQILPAFLAKRTEPKKSYAGKRLENAAGSIYPGFAPHRLDVEDTGTMHALDGSALERIWETATPTLDACLAAFRDYRKDVFAPERFPVHVRVSSIAATDGRLLAVDDSDSSLYLPRDPGLETGFEQALANVRLRMLVGDLDVEASVPTLSPAAAVVEGPKGLELRKLGELASAENGDVWPQLRFESTRPKHVSPIATSLGEIREELAGAFMTGLAGLSPRTTDALHARLTELSLERPASMLRALADEPDSASRVGAFVKLYQLLELAMLRVASSSSLDRDELRPVPGHESILVRVTSEELDLRTISRERAAGRLGRFEAAFHYADYFERQSVEPLLEDDVIWADGTVTEHLVRKLMTAPEKAVDAASDILLRRTIGRAAKLTALELLAEIGTSEAKRALETATSKAMLDEALSERARRAVGGASVLDRARRRLEANIAEYQSVPDAPSRGALVNDIADHPNEDAIPFLRDVYRDDAARDVRAAAARALGRHIDTGSVEPLLADLQNRAIDDRAAKFAVKALADIGDVRALPEILDAYVESWKNSVLLECLKSFGVLVVDPILDVVEEHPALAKRRPLQGVLDHATTSAHLEERVKARLAALDTTDALALHGGSYLELLKQAPHARNAVAVELMERTQDATEPAVKALRRAASRAVKG